MSNKIITLDQLQQLAEKVKSEDSALGVKIAEVASQVEGLVSTGGEANVLNGVKVNGQALAITEKMVDILIAAGEENGTLSVNGAAVAITGLQALAYKAQISENDLDEALKASIAAAATDADLQALTVRVTSAEGNITEIKGDIQSLQEAGYQTSEQVQSAIQTAIAATNHAHYEKADAVPTKETAQANVLYLVKNDSADHYDIYALLGEEVVRLGDTHVDLSGYATTEAMEQAVSDAIEALNIDDYAKASELLSAVGQITTLEAKFASYYTKEELDSKLDGYATDEEAAQAAAAAVSAATASDEEVSSMLGKVFTPAE